MMFEVKYLISNLQPQFETVDVDKLLDLLYKHRNKNIMIMQVTDMNNRQYDHESWLKNLK